MSPNLLVKIFKIIYITYFYYFISVFHFGLLKNIAFYSFSRNIFNERKFFNAEDDTQILLQFDGSSVFILKGKFKFTEKVKIVTKM